MEDDRLTLDKAVTLALQIEEATLCAVKISETNAAKTDVTSVPANTVMDEDFQPPGAIIQQTQPQSSQQRRKCGNCGSIRHANRSPDCPAIGQKCRHCGKVNHFARWCRSKSSSQPSPAVIHTVGPHSITFSSCGVQLKDCCILLLFDTEAKVSLLNMATYNNFFSDVEL